MLPFADDDVQFPVPGLVMLSEADFTAALRSAAERRGDSDGVRWAPLELDAVEAGAVIAGRANHPWTRGVFARVERRDEGVPFSGRLFAVADSPVFDESGRLVAAQKFRIAGVELTGRATWVGTDARLSGELRPAEAGRCCGTPTVCVSPPPGGGNEPPVLMPTGRVGLTTTSRDLYVSRGTRNPEAGAVPYTVYRPGAPDDEPGGPEGVDILGGPLGGGPVLESFGPSPLPVGSDLVCLEVMDPNCAVAKPLCGPDDTGFTTTVGDAADLPLGSSRCASELTRPVRGLNVPEACTWAYFENPTDSACRGTYGGPPRLSPSLPLDALQATRELSDSLFCRVARWVPGSGSPCEAHTERYETARQAALQLELGGVLPGETKTDCQSIDDHGVQRCVTCTNDSATQQVTCGEGVVRPFVDPTVAATSQTTDSDDTGVRDAQGRLLEPYVIRKPLVHRDPDPPSGPAPDPPAPPASATPPPPKSAEPPAGPLAKPDPQPAHTGNDYSHGSDKKGLTRGKGDSTKPAPGGPKQPKKGAPVRKHDPVELGDGSLLLEHADLFFPGPARPLSFLRTYRSSSRARSAMGSNWVHNWDVHLHVYDAATVPSWLSPWCAGLPGMPTAVSVHWGDGSSDLFLLDITTRLYLPHAGSAATVGRTATGWAMRFPDGRLLTFDDMGCLVRDSDRVGNAFAIEWEPTPLGRLYDYFCTPPRLAARNETLAARPHALLAFLVGAGPRPSADRQWWEVTPADFPMPVDPALRAALEYARDYLLAIASNTLPSESIDGGARRRVHNVTDPIGRELRFEYRTAATYSVNPGPDAFRNDPAAGLLERVTGSIGTSVAFTYGRPADYPTELNETFLVSVLRTDQVPQGSAGLVAAPARETRFEYQWPGAGGGAYDTFEADYELRYRAYFNTFVGCRFDAVYVCEGAQQRIAEWAPGNPWHLARLSRNAYISDVADNIVTVTHQGAIEVESRYPADPADHEFDRVVAQRYGSKTATQRAPGIAPDRPTDAWRTTLPKAALAYCLAGPVVGGADRTDGFLPAPIRDRYPLEPSPAPSPAQVAPAASRPGGCDYVAMETLQASLPGWREVLPYFDQPELGPVSLVLPQRISDAMMLASDRAFPFEVDLPPARLWRTPLAPEQLAGAQLWDPAHNDLLSGQVSNPADPTRPLIDRLVGRRRETARNNNRICAWVKQTDRDGHVAYFGLNYRGLALVEAMQEGANQFVFIDRFYNADGNLAEERRPTRSTSPWQRGDGRTLYGYDEIDPKGNRGWNGWLPVFWARRHNLRTMHVEAAGAALDVDETGGVTVGAGRFVQYRYEPLFNQVAVIASGSIAPGTQFGRFRLPATATLQSVTAHLFDYQELSGDVPAADPNSIDPLLDSLRPWGFNWLRNDPAAFAFQLPIDLTGLDLNGDAARGNRFAGTASTRGVGLSVATIELRPGTSSERWWLYRWSPHGLPAALHAPDGQYVRYEYYPVSITDPDAALGSGVPPGPIDANIGFGGFLARTTARIIRPQVGFSHPALTPNAPLEGPYSFLGIPVGTTVGSLQAALVGLGLPSEQVDDLLVTRGIDPNEASSTIGFAYNRAGHVRLQFLATGTAITETDTDGRVVRTEDSRGTVRATVYDAQGRPTQTTTRDRNGNVLSDLVERFDEDDNLVLTVNALVPGAAVDPPPAIDAAVWRYRYTPEGHLEEMTDPEGLVSRFTYDALQRLALMERFARNQLAGRLMRFRHDVYGRLVQVVEAGRRRRGPRSIRSVTYDGLDRPITIVNERGVAWQQAWSARDLLTHERRSEVPYAQTPPAAPISERRFRYNDFSELAEERRNGFVVQNFELSPDGHLISSRGEGSGPTYETTDLLGRPTWSREPDGTETVVTRRESPYRLIATVIRRDDAGVAHSTSTILDLDPLGAVLTKTRVGGSERMVTSAVVDGLGRVSTFVGGAGERARLTRNLAGWVTRYEELTDTAANLFEASATTYDRRGRVTSLSDAAGQVAELQYNEFGELTSTSMNGTPPVTSSFSYDALGRVVTSMDGAESLVHLYDGRHDPVLDRTPQGTDVTRRTFDELGRPIALDYTNPALTWLPEAERTVRTELQFDLLDRVRVERTTLANRVVNLTTSWSTPAGSGWRRAATVQAGAWSKTWEDAFDLAGRFSATGPSGRPADGVRFRWVGDVYAGRVQPQPGWHSPFTEDIGLDAFLLAERRTYRGIGVDSAGNALDLNDAARYSPAGWDPAICGLPLLEVRTVRDPVGRIALETWRHGHPLVTGGALQPPAAPRLRAASYSLRDQLSAWWEADAVTGAIPAAQSYADPAAVIAYAGGIATTWTYDRQRSTGDLLAINGSTGDRRFWIAAPRTLAHQVTRSEAGTLSFTFIHDAGGRIVDDGQNILQWHADGRLAAVRRRGGTLIEAYAYDGNGRMVGLYASEAPSNPPSVRLIYDGANPIAAIRDVQLLWEAAWGPLTNHLIAWSEPGADTRIPLLDGRRSPLAVWDPGAGSVLALATYTPEGRMEVRTAAGGSLCHEHLTGATCSIANLPFAFTGAFRSASTGLVCMGARWYDPRLAQFLSMDPLWFPDGTNRYEYAAGDPVNLFDPSGLSSKSAALDKNKKPGPTLPKPRRPIEVQKPPLVIDSLTPAQELPPPPAPPKLPPSKAQEVQRGIDSIKEKLKQKKTLQQQADIAEERQRRGFDEQTRDLEADEMFRKSPVRDQVIFEISDYIGFNDVSEAITGADWRNRELSVWDRITAGISGAIGVIDTATTIVGVGIVSKGAMGIAAAPIRKTKRLELLKDGTFRILDWKGYPTIAGNPRPNGPFRLLPKSEYKKARNAANNANKALQRKTPSFQDLWDNLVDIHENHPVRLGGSPTDPAGKIVIPRELHSEYTKWWNEITREVKELYKLK